MSVYLEFVDKFRDIMTRFWMACNFVRTLLWYVENKMMGRIIYFMIIKIGLDDDREVDT